MNVHIHPSVDNGVKKGSGHFAGGVLVCKCQDKQVKVGIKGDVAHNHACGCTQCWKTATSFTSSTPRRPSSGTPARCAARTCMAALKTRRTRSTASTSFIP